MTLAFNGLASPVKRRGIISDIVEKYGKLGLKLGRETRILQPGESYSVPIGTVHNSVNPGPDEIAFAIRFDPGFVGFDQMIRILYGLARDEKTNRAGIPKSMATLAVVCKIGDTNLPGLWKVRPRCFGLLPPAPAETIWNGNCRIPIARTCRTASAYK